MKLEKIVFFKSASIPTRLKEVEHKDKQCIFYSAVFESLNEPLVFHKTSNAKSKILQQVPTRLTFFCVENIQNQFNLD